MLQTYGTMLNRMSDTSATIIDGMRLIQKMAGDQSNSAEVAMFVLLMSLKDGSMSQMINDDFNR